MAQRKTDLPNPFISIDNFKPKARQKIIPNKGSNEVYNEDGEIHKGVIGFVTPPKIYDSYRFIKFYKDGLIAMDELSEAGLKVLRYILNIMDYSDTVSFDIRECEKFTKYKQRTHIYKAIRELKEKNILADTDIPRVFFINPLMFYKGDRLKLLL